MKLLELQGDEALDALAEMLEPISEILTDKEITNTWKDNRMKAISIAIKNHKKAVTKLMAITEMEDPETYKADFLTLPKKVMEIINSPEIMSVFTSQGQMMESTASGSATENTGAKKQ